MAWIIIVGVVGLVLGHRIGKQSTIHTISRDGSFSDGNNEYKVERILKQMSPQEAERNIDKIIKSWNVKSR